MMSVFGAPGSRGSSNVTRGHMTFKVRHGALRPSQTDGFVCTVRSTVQYSTPLRIRGCIPFLVGFLPLRAPLVNLWSPGRVMMGFLTHDTTLTTHQFGIGKASWGTGKDRRVAQ